MSAETLVIVAGPGPRTWPCALLHALGLGLVRIAERLDRSSTPAVMPLEPVAKPAEWHDEYIRDLRHRYLSRYY